VQRFLVENGAAGPFEPVKQARFVSDVRGQTGDAAQAAAVLEHGFIAIRSQLGGGQVGSRGQFVAAPEHGLIAHVSQRGGG